MILMVFPVGSLVTSGVTSMYGVISFIVMSSSDRCFWTLASTSTGSVLRLKWTMTACGIGAGVLGAVPPRWGGTTLVPGVGAGSNLL